MGRNPLLLLPGGAHTSHSFSQLGTLNTELIYSIAQGSKESLDALHVMAHCTLLPSPLTQLHTTVYVQ